MAAAQIIPEMATVSQSLGTEGRLRDSFGRAITDLRVAVTDRCNYRCVYCRTGDFIGGYSELPLPDYERMVRMLVGLGVEKIRLTGANRYCERIYRSSSAAYV